MNPGFFISVFFLCFYGLAWTPITAIAEDGKQDTSKEPEIRFDVSYIHDSSEFTHTDHVYSTDNKVLLKLDQVGGDRVRLYDAKTNQPLGPEIKCDVSYACVLAIAPNNKTIAVGGTLSGGCVQVFDGTSGRLIGRWGHDNEIAGLQFSDNGKTLKVRSAHAYKS